MNARINPDRPLTVAEKQARHRANRAAYVRALERALVDADRRERRDWQDDHAETLDRARKSVGQCDG